MTSLINYLFTTPVKHDLSIFTVSVAESVTAGALSNSLCSEPGASQYFKGGVVAYSIQSKKEILGIDIEYAEKNNFANPFTTSEMAKAVIKMFNSRIGLATTGYSLPLKREENLANNECALDIKNPYAIICLYDSYKNYEIIKTIEFTYDPRVKDNLQRATVQSKVSIEGKKIYLEYVEEQRKLNNKDNNFV